MSEKVKLAVRKEQGSVPGGGFHYMLHPLKMNTAVEAALFELMGYVIIQVDPELASKLLLEAREALNHQVRVAVLTEETLK